MTTDAPELPPPQSPATRRWRVELADKTTRTVEARGFLPEHYEGLECSISTPRTHPLTDPFIDPGGSL